MDLATLLPNLLMVAWLLPLASFTLIVLFGPRLGKHGELAGVVATGAIGIAFVLSLIAFCGWVFTHGGSAPAHHAAEGDAPGHHAPDQHSPQPHDPKPQGEEHHAAAHDETIRQVALWQEVHEDGHAAMAEHASADHGSHGVHVPTAYSGEWYALGEFGKLRITIGYHIDALTVCMFTMITLIATCIHFYATGYMHDELHDVTDHEVHLADGKHLHRPGRFHRFFQYLSLFCFSMLGIVIAGNIAMIFVFWELVGICSYFLIGFYIERKSASNAANKAFIANRVGDFGMIIGLMALWSSLGTFNFDDSTTPDGQFQPGIFSQVREAKNEHALHTPDGMVVDAAREEIAAGVQPSAEQINNWRDDNYGYWLLVVAGLGIFCGCVGKSAQFPLHVWLPDAMEGPTPVSALVHSATMVAAGVYLVGRFYPVFTSEVLLVIAYTGAITLFLAATIALTAVDIKRVLAYSTVSQLGYMMLALGIGGWVAGLFHLVTHAFFKSLLFMCSGSVIHAVHTNDMTRMGGLRKKMPYTAYTMLVGCLAIIGAGIPFLIGFSGYYSKDAIIAQALLFWQGHGEFGGNPFHGAVFFFAAAGGASLTAFYMFRLWYMTFAGEPRDHHIYDHAHESPKVMYVPLIILAVFAAGVAWTPFFWLGSDLNLVNLLEQARPAGALANGILLPDLVYGNEHDSHASEIHVQATLVAFSTALAGFLLATVFYGWRLLSADDVRRQFQPIHRFLVNKWYFDELYQVIFIRPVLLMSGLISKFDKRFIDGLIDLLARATRRLASIDDLLDRYVVDGVVNLVAGWTWSAGLSLRSVQTGKLRQYVMLIIVGFVALAILINVAIAK